ncbi:MAG: histidine kinase [Sphingobacterium sp.]
MYRSRETFNQLRQLFFTLFITVLVIYFFFVVPDYFDGSWDFMYLCLTDIVVFLLYNKVFSPWVFRRAALNVFILGTLFLSFHLLILVAVIGLSWAFGGLEWSDEGWDIRNLWQVLVTFIFPSIVGILLYIWEKGVGHWLLIQDSEKRYRELKSEVGIAQLQLVQQELSPHFLNGTLNIIVPLIRRRPQDAIKAIDLCNKILKHYLKHHGQKLVDIADELQQVEYLRQIYELRTNKDIPLRIDCTIKPGEPIYIPPMVLITLMENAFQYGHFYPEGDPVIIAVGLKLGQLIKLEVTNPISARKRISLGTHTAQKRIEALFQLLDPKSARMEVFASEHSYKVSIVFSHTNLLAVNFKDLSPDNTTLPNEGK